MLICLPFEILILIFNYLIPFDIIFPFNHDCTRIDFEKNEHNLKLIKISNKCMVNLAKVGKKLKNIIYRYCLRSVYFDRDIDMNAVNNYKPIRIYAPNDEIFNEGNLKKIFEHGIYLKE